MPRAVQSPEAVLDGFIDKYTPEIAAQARLALRKLRRLIPRAVEMAYDNYQFLAIGFGATERPSEFVISLVLAPRKVSVCFAQGVRVPDPDGLLFGGGNQVRFLRLETPTTLDRTEVKALLGRAMALSPKPFTGPRRLIIKSISATQRPRRPAESAGKVTPARASAKRSPAGKQRPRRSAEAAGKVTPTRGSAKRPTAARAGSSSPGRARSAKRSKR